jgi:hypothetical protein
MPALKDVGEPCEGKPHARFDGGREETNASRLNPAQHPAPPAYPTAAGWSQAYCERNLLRP